MKAKRRNSYYEHNEVHNMEQVNQIVDRIMDEEINSHHCDKSCREISNLYSYLMNETLDMNGTFEAKAETDFFYNGSSVFPNYVQANTMQDSGFGEEFYNLVEFLTYPIKQKLPSLFKSKIAIISSKKLPCVPYIVSNKRFEDEQKTFNLGYFDLNVHLRSFDDERISKILNNMDEKDYINHDILSTDLVLFQFSIAFSEGESGKDFLKQSVEIFSSIERLEMDDRLLLFDTIKGNVKAQFKDDFDEKRRLLTMAVKSMPQDVQNKMSYDEIVKKEHDREIAILSQKLEDLEKEFSNLKNENYNLQKRNSFLEKKYFASK